MLQISQIKLKYNQPDEQVVNKIVEKLRISHEDILSFRIAKMSIDARKKPNVMKIFTVDFTVKNESRLKKRYKDLKEVKSYTYQIPANEMGLSMEHRPIIVGTGPSGIFAAYLLAENGYRPIIFERGECVEERVLSVKKFWEEGILNPESNVQFGEGGAGTFSDGKLTTRTKDPRIAKVLQLLVDNGAPKDILYKNKPHIGTDNLRRIMINMRRKIIGWGGEFFFDSRVTDINLGNGRIRGLRINHNQTIPAEVVILGIGNGARDTFKMLYDRGIALESKPFAVGFRVEHLQQQIDTVQYGDPKIASYLGAADYRLTYRASNGRSVYSFCMCPGGRVVSASSEENHLVVNGMSEYARNLQNANSAIIVGVGPEDFQGNHPLAGIEFQRKFEAKAFELGGGGYTAPVQLVSDFIKGENSYNYSKKIDPSYQPAVRFCNLSTIYPDEITDALREALIDFGKKIKGFDQGQAVLTAVETRSSSPVRIIRDKVSMESISIRGLYPIGEGAGYAGGITSSAVDGIRAFEKILTKYSNIAKI
jgi:hypothetical protein